MERNTADTDIRIVHQIKNSLAPAGNDIEFEIRPETGFRWIKCESPLMQPTSSEQLVFQTKTEKAAYLIKKLLSSEDMKAKLCCVLSKGMSSSLMQGVKRTY